MELMLSIIGLLLCLVGMAGVEVLRLTKPENLIGTGNLYKARFYTRVVIYTTILALMVLIFF